MTPREKVLNTYQKRFGSAAVHLAVAPGRVNLLGEHVDYNDGFVLPAAIDRSSWLAFSPSEDKIFRLLAADFNHETSFTAQSLLVKEDSEGNPLPEWACYAAGVAWAMQEDGKEIIPIQAVLSSDVPRGSGLSSSASVEMAFGVTWQKLNGQPSDPMQLALLGKKAENEYVGVNSGIMDQFASACGIQDKLLLLDCRSLEWQPLPIPADIAIVIADTGKRRSLTNSSYNERFQACRQALKILAQELPGLKSLRDISQPDFENLAPRLPAQIQKRARHVVEEIERTRQALPLLQEGDIQAFGSIMNECHHSLRDLYEVSIPELDVMAETAWQLPGCLGARLTGAGFGGCTVNLVLKDSAAAFSAELVKRYEARCGLKAETYICRASNGARIIE